MDQQLYADVDSTHPKHDVLQWGRTVEHDIYLWSAPGPPASSLPETVVRWHHQGIKLYWRWKSRGGNVGRPRVDAEIRNLIRRMSRENPFWGTPRIRLELQLLGYDAPKATVDKYRLRHRKPPSPTPE